MKTLNKLALVSAMAISSSAMAMQALDDDTLSATTGQDGISIILAGDIAADVVIHDKDGYSSTAIANGAINGPDRATLGFTGATGTAGAIVLDGFKVTENGTNKSGVRVHVDAEGGAEPVLNVNIGLPADLDIETGDIYVANSGGIGAVAASQYTDQVKVLNNVKVNVTGASLNLQLGNAPQGAMIKLAGTMATGLNISNLSLLQGNLPTGSTITAGANTSDQYTPGLSGIHIDNINIASAGSTAWNMTGNINAVNAGLRIDGLGSLDVRLSDVRLGTHDYATGTTVPAAGSIGDVALLGLNVPAVIIRGH